MSIKKSLNTAILAALGFATVQAASAAEITVATVNNADMITLQGLAPEWEKKSGHKID